MTTAKTMKADDEWPAAAQASESVNRQNTNAQFWKLHQSNIGNSKSIAGGSTATDENGAYQFSISNGVNLVNGIVKGSYSTVNCEKKYYFCKRWLDLDNPEGFEEHFGFGCPNAIDARVIVTFLYTDKPNRNCRFCKRELSYDTFENLVGAMTFAHERFKILFEAGEIKTQKESKLLPHQMSLFEDMEAEITEKESSKFT